MHRFDEELKSLEQRIGELEHLRLRQKDLQQELRELETKVRTLRMALRAEEQDVEQLESLTLAAFFQWITGRKEEALDREKAEVRAAALKYQAALLELEDCEQALKKVAGSGRELDRLRAQHADLVAQKRALLTESGHPAAQRILELEGQISRLSPEFQEVREAVSAGWEVLHLTDVITKAMDKIRGAGRMDLLSDSVLPDLYKHKLLNEMQKDIGRLQVALRRFNTEASQARTAINANLPQIGGMLKFADIFFDGLLFDMLTYKKINDSRNQVERAAAQVRQALSVLDGRRKQLERQQAQLQQEIEGLILDAK